ncbi:hypothetical protein BGX26_012649 [Mortierella sp. AD094]|nr:hypothetical protein BGX26_012649 [Mortierella sp. AD094]
MAELIPDLTHYAQGLGPSTFPLRIDTLVDNNDSHPTRFTIVTLENCSCLIDMDGRGFRVNSYSTPYLHTSTPSSPSVLPESLFNTRQQEALSGMVYETIEALLMALSPRFEEFFGQELSRKLNAISWDRFKWQEDAEDSEDPNKDSSPIP